MKKYLHYTVAPLLFVAFFASAEHSFAQDETRWLNAGSLHNWYSSMGAEIEHGLLQEQQYGRRWPAIYEFQDSQAARALWIGAESFTDQNDETFSPKVVHVGPRVSGEQSFFPVDFQLKSRFDEPAVFVDGVPTFNEPVQIDEVDENLIADREIHSTVNTAMGVTMNRTIRQFSQEHHDNYHVIEYEFINTGEVDNQGTEAGPQTLEDVWFFLQNRLAIVRQTRFVFGNETGWGYNTMIHRRGDGMHGDDPGDPFRAQYAWHGNHEDFDDYNNIGGPIVEPNTARGYLTEADSTGRLGAYQFVGHVVLHADAAADDPVDDPNQPATMRHLHSDDDINFNNDRFSETSMQEEYDFMRAGHSERHARVVEPGGDFTQQTSSPALGTAGGYSMTEGYGPYTMEPGDTVRIVIADATSGLSREAAEHIGQQYKWNDTDDDHEIEFDVHGETHSMTKNEWVFTGQDSLYQSFERALENFNSNYDLPREPRPPERFEVNSGGDGIFIDWSYTADDNISGFEVYRAEGRADSTYTLVHEASPAESEFVDDDTNPVGGPNRGRDYYYYIVAVGEPGDNDGAANTPDGVLRSNRYYTQTYDPARLQRPAGTTMNEIAIAPNPYNRSVDSNMRLDDRGDRVAFYDVPGEARIRIYTEVGELVEDFEHTDGSGDAFWDLTTSDNQKISSGVYIIVFEDMQTGERTTRKFVAIL